MLGRIVSRNDRRGREINIHRTGYGAEVECVDTYRLHQLIVRGRLAGCENVRIVASRTDKYVGTAATVEQIDQGEAPQPQEPLGQPEEPPAEESYTERLLKAKRRVWHDRGEDKQEKP